MSKSSNSLLWQLKSPDGVYDSYVLGTMHVRDDRAFGLIERCSLLLEQCSLFCAEYDLSAEAAPSPEIMMQLQAVPHLDELLGEKYFSKLRKVLFKQLGLQLEYYRHLHPMMLTSLVQQQMLKEEQPIILDATLWEQAGEMDMERKGIETIESQMLTMLQLPLEWHTSTLKGMARNFSKFRKKTEKLLNYYSNEQLVAIHRASIKMDGAAKRILSIQRNIQMSDFIEQEANVQSGFFALGAAHLLGEKGVLRLMKKKGFRVRPVGPSFVQ